MENTLFTDAFFAAKRIAPPATLEQRELYAEGVLAKLASIYSFDERCEAIRMVLRPMLVVSLQFPAEQMFDNMYHFLRADIKHPRIDSVKNMLFNMWTSLCIIIMESFKDNYVTQDAKRVLIDRLEDPWFSIFVKSKLTEIQEMRDIDLASSVLLNMKDQK